MMESYSDALAAYLAGEGRTQARLAMAVGTAQPNIHRYAKGDRFPDATIAQAIDRVTGGEVPFDLWVAEAARRVGIPTTQQDAAA